MKEMHAPEECFGQNIMQTSLAATTVRWCEGE
jgi:hypothetical protein